MEPSWQPDPTERHQYRWWDGKGWTDIVADNGEEYVDPHGAPRPTPSGPPRKIVVSTTPEPGSWKPKDPTPWRGMKLPGAEGSTDDSPKPVAEPVEAPAGLEASAGTEVASDPRGPLDPTDQMPVGMGTKTPSRTVIDTTRSDLTRPDLSGPIYADEIVEAPRPFGRIIAAALVVVALVGGALYLWVFRSDTQTAQSENGVSTGKLVGLNDSYRLDVKLARGETVRFRVEGPPNRDLITYFLAPRATADAYEIGRAHV
mgnify:CR=1 FL=1